MSTVDALAKHDIDRGFMLTLDDHARDVAAVMYALLLHDPVREILNVHLPDRDVARLSFLAGLHDAGKVSTAFQDSIHHGYRGLADHVVQLLRMLSLSDDSVSLLIPKRNPKWFETSNVELNYWRALLSHHLPSPEFLADVQYDEEPEYRYWENTERYSPVGALQQLVAVMTSTFPDANRRPKGVLPSDYVFICRFATLVKHADKTASKEKCFPYPQQAGGYTGPPRFSQSLARATRYASSLSREFVRREIF